MAQVMTDKTKGLEGPTFHDRDAQLVLQELGADSSVGLTTSEAVRRLAQHGPNTLPKAAGEGPLVLLWRQINNPLIWVLIGSAVVAMIVDPGDGIKNGLVILAVVIINTLIGFVQEFKAGKAIEALGDMVPENATVLRDGQKVVAPVASLVPGDVVLLASGDKVPADLRLVAVKNLQIEEAALTGESVPVEKSINSVKPDAGLGDRTCLAFNGTLVTYGTATGVVVHTGPKTELGRISTLLKEAADLQTPLTKALESVGKQLTVAIVVVAVLMLIVGTSREMIANGIPFFDAFRGTVIFAVALAVGAIPEGLPAIVTIALSIGVQRMASRRAIVRKLPAVETLGSTSVICSDKTGTLTRNEMTVQALWTPSAAYSLSGVGYSPIGEVSSGGKALNGLTADSQALLELGALCNDASLSLSEALPQISGDPTEAAMVVAAEKGGIKVEELRKAQPRLDVIPFESENQFMGTLHTDPTGSRQIIIKGAPEVILSRCSVSPEMKAEALAAVEAMAAQGMRVLGVAAKDVPEDHKELHMGDVSEGLNLIGLQGMIDPPRPEAIEAVKACQGAGITVKMITGDHKGTAIAIGRQLGIAGPESRPVTGAEIAQMSEDELKESAKSSNVFARVAPEHKLRLVKAIQGKNNVVAMTGDGVNDAPALKQANIGVAMGITGTAVSKEASDIVLTDDNFASIAAAVEEGRRVYDNLIKSLAFVLPTNLGLALILVAAVAFFPFDPVTKQLLLPMLPTQLLWINLVGAVALATPLAFESKEPNVMNRPPRDPSEPVMSRFVVMRTVIAALLMTLGCVGLFLWEHAGAVAAMRADGVLTAAEEALAVSKAQTMAVTTVIMFQIFYMLNCRSLKDSVFKIGVWSNPTVYMGIAAILVLQGLFIYTPLFQQIFTTAPLSALDLLLAAAVGAVILPVVSLEKWWHKRAPAGR
jgi:potassium/sodium efflux P-type ATPase